MNKQNINAIDFLLYTCLGFSLRAKDHKVKDTNEVLNAIIEKAYQDSTMQGAYNALISKKNFCDGNVLDDIKNKSNQAKGDAITEMIKEINHLSDKEIISDEQSTYNDWHKNLCGTLITLYENIKTDKEIKLFTYGNAQKWVNMTMKYLYVTVSIFQLFFDPIAEKFCNQYKWLVDKYSQYFHVPIDNYILEALYGDEQETKTSKKMREFGTDFIIIKIDKTGIYKIRKVSDTTDYSWSTLPEYKFYMDFQEIIQNSIEEASYIDWEILKWNDISIKRKVKK